MSKPRKKEKVLAPPPQRKDDNNTYYTVFCRACLGRYWPRAMPSYGGQCAKCWQPGTAAHHWATFWKECFAHCILRRQWSVIHKSPTLAALNTLESIAKHHPDPPVKIILAAMKEAYMAGPYREQFALWLSETKPLAEAALKRRPAPAKAKPTQLSLKLFGE